jgi:hypothetical protein
MSKLHQTIQEDYQVCDEMLEQMKNSLNAMDVAAQQARKEQELREMEARRQREIEYCHMYDFIHGETGLTRDYENFKAMRRLAGIK